MTNEMKALAENVAKELIKLAFEDSIAQGIAKGMTAEEIMAAFDANPAAAIRNQARKAQAGWQIAKDDVYKGWGWA